MKNMKNILIIPTTFLAVFLFCALATSAAFAADFDALGVKPEPTPAPTPVPAVVLNEEQTALAIAAFPNRVTQTFRTAFESTLTQYKACMGIFTDTTDGLTNTQKQGALTKAQLTQAVTLGWQYYNILKSIDPDCDITPPPSGS